MSPTSVSFLILMIATAALCFLATVFLVPRLWKHRVLKYVAQAVSVILTTVLTLLAVVAVLNAQNLWYTTWDAVFHNPSIQQAVTKKVYGNQNLASYTADAAQIQTGPTSSLQEDPKSNPAFGSQISDDTSQGAYVTFSVSGEKSGATYNVLMWLPPSYFQNTNRFYPVIVGFTGFPGSTSTYSQDFNFGQMIMDQVNESKMQESILVVPDVMPGNNDTECVDGTQGDNPPKVETYVTEDLLPWIQQNLRTIDNPQARATTGYSAGGWCASMFTVRHPDLFGAALNQSGYFKPVYSDGQQWADPNDARYVLSDRVAADKPDVDLFFYASEDDPLAMNSLPAFANQVASPTSLVVETVPTGGHTMNIWRPGATLGLQHLGQSLKFFAPV